MTHRRAPVASLFDLIGHILYSSIIMIEFSHSLIRRYDDEWVGRSLYDWITHTIPGMSATVVQIRSALASSTLSPDSFYLLIPLVVRRPTDSVPGVVPAELSGFHRCESVAV